MPGIDSFSGEPQPLNRERLLSPISEQLVMELPWIKAIGEMPSDAVMPRIMTGINPRAVGSYGPSAIEWLADSPHLNMRWWQALCISRLLEFDVNGDLVWTHSIFSTARQVGKSVMVRALCLWRLHQMELFGNEQQFILGMSTSLRAAKEIQRPAHYWAKLHGMKVYTGEAYRAIEAPTGRWIIATPDSAHGYTVNFAPIDEAWGIPAAVIEDHVEPTILAANNPQILFTSTAHQDSTSLMRDRRSEAIAEMETPGSSLIIEWSMAPDDDYLSVDSWRKASPIWTDQRETLMRARAGGDAISFKTQYGNIWPSDNRALADGPLIDPISYTASKGAAPVGLNSPVLCLEDNFGDGQCVALAERDGENVHVTAETFASRADAWAYIAATLADDSVFGARVLIGASLYLDPTAEALGIAVELRGSHDLRSALPLYRALMQQRRITHDADNDEMENVITSAKTVRTSTGMALRMNSTERLDIVRAVCWAIAEAAQNEPAPAVA
jgi:hypothetical protein